MTAHRQRDARAAGLAALEIVAALGVATGAAAALDGATPAPGLGPIYLVAVLWVAIRRGQLAALAAAVGGTLLLNYLFIPPVHRLAVARGGDVVTLVVLVTVAVVVGRLAAAARSRAAEAEERAREAARREREAALVAEAATAVLEGEDLDQQLARLGERVARATGARSARFSLGAGENGRPGERRLHLPVRARPAALYLEPGPDGWDPEDLDRLREPLARLLDVAVERDRAATVAAEADSARRASAVQTAVLRAISHDLRTPLTGILAAASALGQPGLPETDRRELADVVATEAEHLASMVSDLLDLSRIEAGAVEPRQDWCDLADVVAGAAERTRGVNPAARVEISLPADLPLIRADAAQLERVFANLLDNAVKFSDGDPVRVSGGTGGGRVVVRVTDRGPGIPRAQRATVFEPFARGREPGAGTGLGLAIVRGFVEANGGRISLLAPPEGGASFAVSFPLLPQPAAAA